MVSFAEIREFLYTLLLVGGLSVAGTLLYAQMGGKLFISVDNPVVHHERMTASPIVLVANPVVHIQVPEHNIFNY